MLSPCWGKLMHLAQAMGLGNDCSATTFSLETARPINALDLHTSLANYETSLSIVTKIVRKGGSNRELASSRATSNPP